jgi:hypothetical protein
MEDEHTNEGHLFETEAYWNQFDKTLNKSTGGSNVNLGIIDGPYQADSYAVESERSTITTTIPELIISGVSNRGESHAKRTSQTLFHQNPTISHENLTMRGLAHNANKYHFMIDRHGKTNTISLVQGLSWALKNDLDVLGIPLNVGEDDVIKSVFEEFLERSNCLTILSGGNSEICETQSHNYLSTVEYSNVISVGTYSTRRNEAFSSTDIADLMTLSDITITDDITYSGTSSAGTITAGIASQYLGILKENYSELSDEQQQEIVVTALLSSPKTLQYSNCSIDVPVLEPEKGLQRLYELANTA